MFKSVDQALKWAYQVSGTPIVKMSSINSMRGASGGGDMTPHDQHAQAALIISIIQRALDCNEMAFTMAHYGRELQGGDNKAAVTEALTRVVLLGLPSGVHNRRGVSRMIESYFRKDPLGQKSLQKDLGACTNRRYYEYKTWVKDILSKLGARAEDSAHRALEDAGIVVAEEIAA